MKKKRETIERFMHRRNHEKGKVPSAVMPRRKPEAAGSHSNMVDMVQEGLVKKGTRKKLERTMKKRKRKAQDSPGV